MADTYYALYQSTFSRHFLNIFKKFWHNVLMPRRSNDPTIVVLKQIPLLKQPKSDMYDLTFFSDLDMIFLNHG